MKQKILIALWLLLPLSIVAQPMRPMAARNITMADGLCSYTVRALAQDPRGFVWMGTDGGLCRYDGTLVQPFVRPGVVDQFVGAIQPLSDGLVVGTTQGALFFRFSTEQFAAIDQKAHDGVRLTARVSGIVADRDSNVWIATHGQGLFCYSPRTKELAHIAAPQAGGYLQGVYVDSRNQVYALTARGLHSVLLLDRSTSRLTPFALPDEVNQGKVMSMLRLDDGSYLYGTWLQGLVTPKGVVNPADNSLYHIHSLLQQSDGTVLVGSDAGLFVFHPDDQSVTPFPMPAVNPLLASVPALSPKFVYSMVNDREGGLWFSTFYGGVFYVSPMGFRFRSLVSETSPLLRGNIVSRFCEDHQHRIWVASDDGGVDCYDPSTGQMVDFAARGRLAKVNAHAFLLEGDDLLIGTYGQGILRMNTLTGAVSTVVGAPASVYSLYRDSRGRLWVGAIDGVFQADLTKGSFRRMQTTRSLTSDIMEDQKGNVWFATQEDGLSRYDRQGRWCRYLPSAKGRMTLPVRQVSDLCVIHDGRVLVATPYGVYVWRPATDDFEPLELESPTRNISAIVEDGGVLWLSSDQGILKYSATDGLQTFNRYDGIAGEQFCSASALKGSDGCIYFGSLHGFTCFYPYQVKVNTRQAPVVITRLDILGQPVTAGTNRLPQALTAASEIDIYAGDDMFAIHFASLSYCSPEKNRYAYMLDGFDKRWNYTVTPIATYTGLPAGTYTFRVRATNNDGVWSGEEARLTVVVHPPFWWSWPARVFYLLLIAAAVWFYLQMRLRAAERAHRYEMRRLNERKDLEVKEARLRFFTMIAHEIRTPVSLIIGPLETLMRHVANHSNDTVLASQGDSLKMIDRNAHRLLELVNQLLDFNKVQQAGLEMRFADRNIYDLVHAVAERFAPTLEQKGARFTVDYPPEQFTAIVDAEAVTKVISNLMTNATKYTRSLVALSCKPAADGQTFTITVADDGVGISPSDQKKIFGAFYQAQDNKPGTGIGLSIVESIVKMHGGKVSVESQLGRGATFTVVLPVKQQLAVPAEDPTPVPTPDAEAPAAESAPQAVPAVASAAPTEHPYLLIVDDNIDMLHFLTDHFRADYTVVSAQNGEEALEKLRANPIAMIISDWMMPVMDGPTFCREIRKDRRYSHIPFVMLTAKTDDASKTESMNCGADAYIEKPFSMEYLTACIRNTLDMRHRLFQMFSTTPEATVSEMEASPVDSELLQQMTKLIEDHIDSKELNVNFLADQLNISRSGLFAKVKAITDVTPNELIQVIRLKHAAQLLREGKYRVNEVSYMVGFSSPSYFSKCFTKQFGKKPGEFK